MAFFEGLEALDLPGLIAFILQLFEMAGIVKSDKVSTVKQHLPGVWGLSRTDEGIWVSLLTRLEKSALLALTRIVGEMRLDQVQDFRLNVASAPIRMIPVKDKDGKVVGAEPAKEFTDADNRVRFLREVCALEEEKGARWVIDEFIVKHQLVGEKPSALMAWLDKNICEFFGVKNLDGLTEKKLVEGLKKIAGQLKELREKRMGTKLPMRNFFAQALQSWLFWPIVLAILAVTILPTFF